MARDTALAATFDDRVYHDLGEINWSRVLMLQTEVGSSGLGASQQAIQKAIAVLHPCAVIMVGIAFGVDESKQDIGEILVSQQLWHYELQRVGTDEKGSERIVARGDRPHASTKLLNYLRSALSYWSGATVTFGLVLSGEELVDNFDFREQLRAFEPEAIGGDMEGGGLYVACQESKTDWILVKAVCDWGDGHKSIDKASRQALAAPNSAEFVVFALQRVVLPVQDEKRIVNGSTNLTADTAATALVPKRVIVREASAAEIIAPRTGSPNSLRTSM